MADIETIPPRQAVTLPRFRDLLVSTWEVFRANWAAITIVSLVVNVPCDLITASILLKDDATNSRWFENFRRESLVVFWTLTLGIVATVHLTAAQALGERLTTWQALRRGLRDYGAAILLQFLYAIFVLVGSVLLVVPGVLVLVYLMFLNQVLVIEGQTGIQAIRRSFGFVKGRWWAFARYGLAIFTLQVALSFLWSFLLVSLPESPLWDLTRSLPIGLLLSLVTVMMTRLFLMGRDPVASSTPATAGDSAGQCDLSAPMTS